MALTPPTVEPTALQAGNTATWTREFADFSAADGWSLTYRLVSRSGLTAIDITAAADGSGFLVEEPAAATALWDAGQYTLYGYVSKSPDRFTVYKALIDIFPDAATADFVDSRTYLQKVLEKLEAVLLEGVIREVIRYSYGGVSTEVQTMKDVLDARDRILALIAQEDAAATGTQQKILARFVNPR